MGWGAWRSWICPGVQRGAGGPGGGAARGGGGGWGGGGGGVVVMVLSCGPAGGGFSGGGGWRGRWLAVQGLQRDALALDQPLIRMQLGLLALRRPAQMRRDQFGDERRQGQRAVGQFDRQVGAPHQYVDQCLRAFGLHRIDQFGGQVLRGAR